MHLSRLIARASGGGGFIFIFAFFLVPAIHAMATVQTIEPLPIICESWKNRGIRYTPPRIETPILCFRDDHSKDHITDVTFTINADLENFIVGQKYLLKIHRRGDSSNVFGYAKGTATNGKTLIFHWDLTGYTYGIAQTATVFYGFARPGKWELALYASERAKSINQHAAIPLNDNEFQINYSTHGNPRFYATERCHAAGEAVEFIVENPDPGKWYTVWWHGQGTLLRPGSIPSTSKQASLDERMLKIHLPGIQQAVANQKACMAVIHAGTSAGLNCDDKQEDFATLVSFQPTANPASCGPGPALGWAQGDSTQNYAVTTRSTHRFDPYNIIKPCAADGIQTSIGCLPTTTAGLVQTLLRIVIGIGGGVALILMAFASIQMMTAQGDPEKLHEGREKFIGAAAGLLFIIFSIFLLNVIGVQILAIPGFGG